MRKLFVICAGLVMLTGCSPTEGDAISKAKQSVQDNLKDPNSAEFSDVIFYPDAIHADDVIQGYVCGLVNAKNSLGGYSGNKRFAVRVSLGRGRDVINNPVILGENVADNVKEMQKEAYKKACTENK
ncbi:MULTISPECIES: hypothetical protein [Photorhabdus]|uniref:Lipoprotein n=1 Tax=Photorhabdus luminescens subsp. mexicana TaxID=2100167 RepID=A0A4R4ITJ3_PHOLU|nr:hypothetical protein [Photorhabdus luminescens]TDB44104.1 hypothetical protein C5468_23020 [Photorhabdus luminescens subsp. mexicana]